MIKIKRLICINVPIKSCNLKCQYCYISQLKQFEKKPPVFRYDAKHIRKCLSRERLGGSCIINLTGNGETLIPPQITGILYELLAEGHFLEVVTNGTLSRRFEEIAAFPREFLQHLEFKFSFHYLELKRLKLLDTFFENVKRMQKAGCSFTLECVPHDGLEDHMEELKEICMEKAGALCQLTVARTDVDKAKKIYSHLSDGEYRKLWSAFRSPMFDYKMDILSKKQKSFCYAGLWSLYVDLGSGDAKQCYGQMVNQNIFHDPDKKIIFEPVGNFCTQPYCYNGHAFLTLGMIPGKPAPTYCEIRNRECGGGKEWFTPVMKEAFSCKLYQNNRELPLFFQWMYNLKYIMNFIPLLIKNRSIIRRKIKRRLKG